MRNREKKATDASCILGSAQKQYVGFCRCVLEINGEALKPIEDKARQGGEVANNGVKMPMSRSS